MNLSKAFGSLEWSFIHDTLIAFNFPHSLVKLTMNIISTSAISVLWNGKITPDFFPSKGIRQGNPLSSYIFVLCMERLSHMIEDKVRYGSWKPLKITKDINISHLLYADDVFIFGKASTHNLSTILQTLHDFGFLSGLNINFQKSNIIFLAKMDHYILANMPRLLMLVSLLLPLLVSIWVLL